ncbi:MAG: alanine racemase [Defluviitaleaceae bacterium]|nr:alanine racemase [Defluviitaleaceae bacterium]
MDYRRSWAEINTGSLAENYRAVRRLLPAETKLIAVVKADGYGHGAVECARVFLYCGAEMLGVATCEEGVWLRENHIAAPILVMGFTPEPLLGDLVRHNLTATVFSAATARSLSAAASSMNETARAHIKIDTGMGRLGFLPDGRSADEIAGIAALPSLVIDGVYTHFATSDALDNSFMGLQNERFARMLGELVKRGVSIPMRHASNSGALAQTLRSPNGGKFFMDAARVGILLYGMLPSAEMKEACEPLNLRPALRLLTQVGMVKRLPKGSGISYNHTFVTKRESLIATLPVGYADGYPRRLSNKACVIIRGKLAPLVGSVCMDQCMADVTEIPDVEPGDETIMIGGRITADSLAEQVGTIGYEIVCQIGKRVPRVYVK